jgi:uncharacterized membrane-anchored protein
MHTAPLERIFTARKSIPLRFAATLLVQAGLILAIPAQAVYTHLTGEPIVLQTMPVDPYNPLQGYYLTFRYTIANLQTLETLPGWETIAAQLQPQPRSGDGSSTLDVPTTSFYVILQSPEQVTQPPQPWKPIAVSDRYPDRLEPNQAVIQGIYRQGTVRYGLETYYIPEDQQVELNQQLRQVGQAAIQVEAKVGADGHAVPLGFWVDRERYQF